MTRKELIEFLASKHSHLPYHQVEAAVKKVFEEMAGALMEGRRIEVRGFGSFSVRYHAPRRARNPKTGESVTTQGKHTPRFKSGKELRERVDAARENGVELQQ